MEVRKCNFWIKTNFGKKLYINYGSVLRAARLKRIDFFFNTKEYQCTYDVAGLGIVEEKLYSSGCSYHVENLDVYDSIESFKAKKIFGYDEWKRSLPDSVFPGIIVTTEDILTKAFENIATIRFDKETYSHYPERYIWNGVAVVKVELNGNVWMDEEGFHTNAKIPSGTFLTKEECEEANQISVIEFEDEE